MKIDGFAKSPSSNSRRSDGSWGGGHFSLGHSLSHSHELRQSLYLTLCLSLSLNLKLAIPRLAKWLPRITKETFCEVIKIVCATLSLILLAATPVMAGDKVVARVGNEPITRMEVETALAQNPGVTRDKVLESLIERSLVLSWANSKSMTVTEEEVDSVARSLQESNNLTADQFDQALRARGETMETFRDDLRVQLLINRALGAALRNKVSVSEEEIVKLYQETYPPRETYELRHILFKVHQGASEEDALTVKRQADKVLGEIQAGALFDVMVRQHSQDTSSVEKGGQLGTFHLGELIPELENAVLGLAVGETGGPVRTSAGYHIVHLQSRGTEEPPPLITVRDQLQSRLMEEKETGARNDWLREIRAKTYVEIFPDEL